MNSNNALIFKSPQEFVKYWDQKSGFVADARNIVLFSGGFDPIHPGHIDYIQHKSPGIPERCKKVVVVNGDSFLKDKKGKPFMDVDTRSKIVSSIRGVDYVVIFENPGDSTVCGALETIKPLYFAKGGDRNCEEEIPEWKTCKNNGIEILLGCGPEKRQSSSGFLSGSPNGVKNES